MSVMVRMMTGTLWKVKGDRWTEPPVQPSPIPGVLKSDFEVDREMAEEVSREVQVVAERRKYLIHGKNWAYEPIEESLFVVVYDGDRKVAAFNPTEVLMIHDEGAMEEL